MCECHKKSNKPYHRFTLFTQDADEILTKTVRVFPYYDPPTVKKYGFKWKLNFGKSITATNLKMSIESIFCRDSRAILGNDHNLTDGFSVYFSEREKGLKVDINNIEGEETPAYQVYLDAENTLETNKQNIKDLDDEIIVKNTQINDKNNEITLQELDIGTQNGNIENKIAEIDAKNEEINNLDNTQANYATDLEQLQGELEQLITERDTLQAEYGESQDILQVFNNELVILQNELVELENQKTNLENDQPGLILSKDTTKTELDRISNEKKALVNELFDLNKDAQADAQVATLNAICMGNIDEKEIYTIRCDQVNSSYFYDSRPSNEYVKKPIIYMGALKFNNSNPRETFCYQVNPDIMNSDFTLYIDDNHRIFDHPQAERDDENDVGIRTSLNVGITFILYDD